MEPVRASVPAGATGPGRAAAPDRAVGAGLRPVERAGGLAAALVGFVIAAGVIADNSFLTHLATGRLILDGGWVPSTDPYSRFGLGEAWTVQSWLASLIYAGAERAAGPPAIRLFHGLLGALIGLGLWRLSAPAVRTSTRVALTGAPLVVGAGLWSPRPLLIGLAGLVVVLVIEREDRSPRWLVPVLWVWANAHGSFPLAVGYLVLTAGGRWFDDRRLARRDRRLVGWAVVGTLSAALGPLGIGLLTFPLGLLTRRDALTGVVEWEAPSFTSVAELVWIGVALLTVVGARRGLGLAGLLPATAFTVAALLALRNVAPAAIVVVAAVAPSLSPRPGRVPARAADRVPVGGPTVDGSWRDRLARPVGVAAATALLVAVFTVATRPAIELDRYPVEAIDALEAGGLVAVDGVVVVHREAVGNYLIWRFGPDARVFVDDRFDFHDPALLTDHRDLLAGRHPREILDRRGADVVIWESDGPLASWLAEAPEWSARTGEEWTVACRVDTPAGDRCPSPGPPPVLADGLPAGG